MQRWRIGLILLAASCAPALHPGPLQSIVNERLYLGRNIRDSLGVTDSDWAIFVKEVVAVQLPGGFTFWAAQGGPRPEPTFVLEIVHPARASATDSAIVAIIAEYKRRFRQESVLRVVTPGRASF